MAEYIIQSGGWETGGSSMEELLELAIDELDGHDRYEWQKLDKEQHDLLLYNRSSHPSSRVYEIFKITDGKSYSEHVVDVSMPEEGVEFLGYFRAAKAFP